MTSNENTDPTPGTPGPEAPHTQEPEEHTSPLTWEAPPAPEAAPARNPFSVTYLVAGLVFLGIAGLWLAQQTGAVEVADLDLLVPLLLVVVGVAGLVAGLARAARRD